MELFFKTITVICKEYQLHIFGSLIALVKLQFDANKKFSVREKEVNGKFELHELRSINNEERSKDAQEKSYKAFDKVRDIESNVSYIKNDISDIKLKVYEKLESSSKQKK
ncbi:MAG: hypothetical protein GY760_04485 [Deltaproteobacteria bacterium]|nr:hypothetical protein [Deltaproteobacteria bacterium]